MAIEKPELLKVCGYTFTHIKLKDMPKDLKKILLANRPGTHVDVVTLECYEQIYFIHQSEEDKLTCYGSFWKKEAGEWCAVDFNEHHTHMGISLSKFVHTFLNT